MANRLENLVLGTLNFSSLKSLNDVLDYATPFGSIQRGAANSMYGINHLGNNGIVPENRDSNGLVFFTRPMLNLSRMNIKNVTKMYNLLTNDSRSVQRYVRCMLDPRLALPNGGVTMMGAQAPNASQAITNENSAMKCPLIDENLAFIPILTNNIKELSGFPDPVLPTYTSNEGIRRQQWGIGDGFLDIYESFDISCTFRNTRDEPILMLFHYWIMYISLVFEGLLAPYMDFLVENEIDYNTRIYRLVLDETNRVVKKIAAVGAAFPYTVPFGKFFDFTDQERYNSSTRDIQIVFKCFGAEYNRDITIREFNDAVCIFHPGMNALVKSGNYISNELEKVPYRLLPYFNNRCYPYINTETLELEWYVNRNSKVYQKVMSMFSKRKDLNGPMNGVYTGAVVV